MRLWMCATNTNFPHTQSERKPYAHPVTIGPGEGVKLRAAQAQSFVVQLRLLLQS